MQSEKLNYFKISIAKITIYTVLSVIVVVAICLFDNKVLKINPIIYITKYDDICLVIWQIQATISSIVIAVLALIIGKANKTYYGLEVKEILCLSKRFSWGLNFWEKVIFALLLNMVTYIAVIFNSLFAVTLIGLFSLVYTVNIILVCIKVSLDSDYIMNCAKNYLDKLIQQCLEMKEKYEAGTFRPEGKQLEFNNILENIFDSVQDEIIKGRNNIYQSKDMKFIIKVFRKYNEHNLNGMREQLLLLFYNAEQKAMFAGQDDLALELCKWVVDDECTSYLEQGIETMIIGIGKGYIKDDVYTRFNEWVKIQATQSLNKSSAMVIAAGRYALKYGQIDFLKKIIQGILSYSNYKNDGIKESCLHSILAYSYYLSLKEPLYINEYGLDIHSKVYSQCQQIIFESDPKTFAQYIELYRNSILGICILLNICVNDRFKYNRLEIITNGGMKSLHLFKDSKEYALFYLFTHFNKMTNDEYKYISEIDISILIEFREQLNESGQLIDSLTSEYNRFIEWSKYTAKTNNIVLVKAINRAIYQNKIKRAIEIREDKDIISNKLNSHKGLLLEKLKNSNLLKTDKIKNPKLYKIIDKSDISIFDPNIATFGREDCVLQYLYDKMFYGNINYFRCCAMDFDKPKDTIKNIKNELNALSKIGVNIDMSWKDTLSQRFCYYDIDENDRKYINNFDNNISQLDNWKPRGIISIYTDSSKFLPAFSVSDNFVSLQEYLDNDQLDKMVKDEMKDGEYGFTVQNETFIPCTKEEAIEYYKQTQCVLKYEFTYEKADGICGFCLKFSNN